MGRGLGRLLRCLGLTEDISVGEAASVGNEGDSERPIGEIGGVLAVDGETSSFWRSASSSCWSKVT